ncbi:iron hydrogenase [Kalaharituber pfeilii]|nr:iron hydrogenase [Kalaharituber pfeilii]
MSAILSADDLNDFISPGVACIKPVESLPPNPAPLENPYEVRNEDTMPAPTKTAQISLTDCLACSGCVTSAEAVLVQLQSVQEVIDNLVAPPSAENGNEREKVFVALISPQSVASLAATYGVTWREVRAMIGWLLGEGSDVGIEGRLPVEKRKDRGEEVIRRGGRGFKYIIDTDVGRDVATVYAFEELFKAITTSSVLGEDKGDGGGNTGRGGEIKKPILTSACPGFICYAEAVHPYLIPHLSRLKSPQAILGTLVKSVLPILMDKERGVEAGTYGAKDVYVVGLQPCFDKKLEGARGELTSATWRKEGEVVGEETVRDVDCVITTRELVTLAEECGIEFGGLPRLEGPQGRRWHRERKDLLGELLEMVYGAGGFRYTPSPLASIQSTDLTLATGTSGGYLHYILLRLQSLHPGSYISITKGRNSDTVEYALLSPPAPGDEDKPREIIKLARSYGFRNIQNLVRKLKPVKKRVLPRFGKRGGEGGKVVLEGRKGGGGCLAEEGTGYAYVEVMACPGGCTNGGGQVKMGDGIIRSNVGKEIEGTDVATVGSAQSQREWLAKVDEAYWSDEASSQSSPILLPLKEEIISTTTTLIPVPQGKQQPFNIDPDSVEDFVNKWEEIVGVEREKLLFTGYRRVEDEFAKKREEEESRSGGAASARAVGVLAGKAGGGGESV